LNLPKSILRYNESRHPDNGEKYTFDGASLKINLLKKYMLQQGAELNKVLKKQQEAAGIKT
jgi:hypothetical protein